MFNDCSVCCGEGGWMEDTGAITPWGDWIEVWVECPECDGTGADEHSE